MTDDSEYFRKKPQQSRSRSVVNAILQAADQLLERTGDPQKVSLQGIADRAGVGIGSLYDYFADRGSVLSGLAAKVTEDNLRAFEDHLERTRHEPLPVAISGMVDLLLDTYLGNVRVPRVVLRVAHRVGLMPTLAESVNLFATTLAAALRQRNDVRKDDLDAVAYIMTNMAMGIIHTSIWSERRPLTDPELRAALVSACLRLVKEGS
jgi:AcrR family transcriptional regulator